VGDVGYCAGSLSGLLHVHGAIQVKIEDSIVIQIEYLQLKIMHGGI